MKKDFSRFGSESEPTIRNKQHIAELVADALMESASRADFELDVCYALGEPSDHDGGVTISTMLDSGYVSIGLIEDRKGEMWLAWWRRGQEEGHLRRVELGDNVEELIEFSIGLL